MACAKNSVVCIVGNDLKFERVSITGDLRDFVHKFKSVPGWAACREASPIDFSEVYFKVSSGLNDVKG